MAEDFSYDPESFVHVPRVEDHRNWGSGRDVFYTPEGRYVGDTQVVPFADGEPELEIRFHTDLPVWGELENLYDIRKEISVEDVHPSESVLGYVNVDQAENVMDKKSFRIDDGNSSRAYVTNIDSEFPSIFEVYVSTDKRDISSLAAGYAVDLANIRLEEHESSMTDVTRCDRSTQESLWESVFVNSLNNAESVLEERTEARN